MDKVNILVVDDELSMRQFLEILLKKEGYDVDSAENGNIALEKLKTKNYSVVLMDYNMPEGVDGLELLTRIKRVKSSPQVVVITAYASTEQAIKAIELGAMDYVSKPFNVAEIKDIAKKAIEEHNSRISKIPVEKSSNETAASKRSPVSESRTMKKVLQDAKQVSPTDSSVLITGESGAGKEVIAEYIHYNSLRKNFPWYPINCGALPENLQESELFGYEKGAFTGADQMKKGYFEVANGGTLFLDEVAELGLNTQVKLLRILQEKSFMRVGGTEKIDTNVRLIAATNKNLRKEIERGTFREELFFRLNVFEIYIPPLRERVEDIIPFARLFLGEFNKKFNREVILDDEVEKFLLSYNFPGNVRELHNIIERGFVLARNSAITMSEIRISKPLAVSDSSVKIDGPVDLDGILAGVERKYIAAALEKTRWNKHETAVTLGMTERSLRYRMDKLGIKEKNDSF